MPKYTIISMLIILKAEGIISEASYINIINKLDNIPIDTNIIELPDVLRELFKD